jgi:hypothetical protein
VGIIKIVRLVDQIAHPQVSVAHPRTACERDPVVLVHFADAPREEVQLGKGGIVGNEGELITLAVETLHDFIWLSVPDPGAVHRVLYLVPACRELQVSAGIIRLRLHIRPHKGHDHHFFFLWHLIISIRLKYKKRPSASTETKGRYIFNCIPWSGYRIAY